MIRFPSYRVTMYYLLLALLVVVLAAGFMWSMATADHLDYIKERCNNMQNTTELNIATVEACQGVR